MYSFTLNSNTYPIRFLMKFFIHEKTLNLIKKNKYKYNLVQKCIDTRYEREKKKKKKSHSKKKR